MATAGQAVPTAAYRFVGAKHYVEGRLLKVGEVVQLTARQAKNFGRTKFRPVSEESAAQSAAADDARVAAVQIVAAAEANARQIAANAASAADKVLADADADAKRIVGEAQTQAEKIVADAVAAAK